MSPFAPSVAAHSGPAGSWHATIVGGGPRQGKRNTESAKKNEERPLLPSPFCPPFCHLSPFALPLSVFPIPIWQSFPPRGLKGLHPSNYEPSTLDVYVKSFI